MINSGLGTGFELCLQKAESSPCQVMAGFVMPSALAQNQYLGRPGAMVKSGRR